jgi:hypothetical protein
VLDRRRGRRARPRYQPACGSVQCQSSTLSAAALGALLFAKALGRSKLHARSTNALNSLRRGRLGCLAIPSGPLLTTSNCPAINRSDSQRMETAVEPERFPLSYASSAYRSATSRRGGAIRPSLLWRNGPQFLGSQIPMHSGNHFTGPATLIGNGLGAASPH